MLQSNHSLNYSYFNERELFSKLQQELVQRYNIDEKLASEMAFDLIDVLSAIDSDIDIFKKYFLH
jgi:hypothetical protein